MPPFKIVYTISDDKGRKSQLTFNYPYMPLQTINISSVDPTVLALNLGGLIETLTNGAIISCNVIVPVDVSTLQPLPTGLSDVEEGGRFHFRTVNGFNTYFRLPTLREKFVLANGKIDLENSNVQAFVNAILDPVSIGSVNSLTDARGDAIATLVHAVEDFKRSRP